MSEQSLAALRYANEIRSARAELKRKLRAGETNIARVLADCPPEVRTMPLGLLLLSCPAMGRLKLDRICFHLDLDPRAQVQSFHREQMVEILVYLRERYPAVWKAWCGA